MSYFIRNGNTFKIRNESDLLIHDKLPAGNYILKLDPNGAIIFEIIDNFVFNIKRYGNNVKNTDRILSTFMSRDVSTGVLLSGEKGSGKSLLAKTISIEAAKEGIPTIVINSPWRGDAFNSLIQEMEQPAIILFDEFEKVYDSQELQYELLTLLDGVFPSKKLFIITCNDKWRIDSHMRNRPGRIFYLLEFNGIEREFIIEYCEDNLNNKNYISKICNIASVFYQFNFDMLKALVEEMNRYNETPEQSLHFLNVRPEFDSICSYDVEFTHKGKTYSEEHNIPADWRGNPLYGTIEFEYLSGESEESEGLPSDNYTLCKFSSSDLTKIDSQTGSFIFDNKQGAVLKLTKKKEVTRSHYDYF